MKFSSSSLFALLVSAVNALGQNATVTLSPGKGLLQLAGSGTNGQILVSANDWWGVLRAAEDLAGDVGKVTGRNLTLGNWMAGGPGKRDLEAEERDVASGPKGGSSGEGGSDFPAGGHSGGWGWGWGGGSGHEQSGTHPPGSPGHNVTSTGSSGTTVYYTFNPVTSFINVSKLFFFYRGLFLCVREVWK
jgi:hypothetical protein